jgi:hypothetical protein
MTNAETSMPNEVPMPNVEGARRDVKRESVRPIVLGLLFVAVPLLLALVMLAIQRPQPRTPETYTGPFRLGMTFDEAKQHLSADNYLSKVFYKEEQPPAGKPVWYTLTEEEDGGTGTLFFDAEKKIMGYSRWPLPEQDSVKINRSE